MDYFKAKDWMKITKYQFELKCVILLNKILIHRIEKYFFYRILYHLCDSNYKESMIRWNY